MPKDFDRMRGDEGMALAPPDAMQRGYLVGAAATQPRRITLGPFGSRNAMLSVTFGQRSVWLETGCFAGTVEDFEAEVNNKYPRGAGLETVRDHGEEYRAVVDLLKRLVDLYCQRS